MKSFIQLAYASTAILDIAQDICESLEIANCKEVYSSIVCNECNVGYYLSPDKSTCIKNSFLPIMRCVDYTTHDSCLVCESGFYIIDNPEKDVLKGCKQSSNIENCKEYSQTIDECIECSEKYFLEDKVCKLRPLYPINSCESYEKTKDLCQACVNNFKLTTDQQICFPNIENCSQYSVNNQRLLQSTFPIIY